MNMYAQKMQTLFIFRKKMAHIYFDEEWSLQLSRVVMKTECLV